MIVKIKYFALCGFLVLGIVVCSHAACNAPNGTAFTISSASISGPTDAYVGMPDATYTCTIVTDPAGYEGELDVTWGGDVSSGGVVSFADASKRMITATVSGDGCRKTCDPKAIHPSSISGFNIYYTSEAGVIDTVTASSVTALAQAIGSQSDIFTVTVIWAESEGGGGSGWIATFPVQPSHGYPFAIAANASRGTESFSDSVSMTTENSILKAQYDALILEKTGLIGEGSILGADIILLNVSLTQKNLVKQEKLTALQAATAAVDEYEESVDSIETTVTLVEGVWEVYSMVTSGPAMSLYKLAEFGTEAAATAAMVHVAQELVAEIRGLTVYTTETDALAAFDAASYDVQTLENQIGVKEGQKAIKELRISAIVTELAALRVAL